MSSKEKLKEIKEEQIKDDTSEEKNIENIEDSEFEEKIDDGKWLVDYWAPWCSPCKVLEPIVEELSKDMDGINFGKVNVDQNQLAAQRFGIRSIPTMIIFEDGEEVARSTGAMEREELKEWIKSNI
ncbi:MAG: thioredoxin [Candidatus Aenigmatarchaeota archaeon]